MQLRTDLAIEAREIAGDRVSGTAFSEHTENGLKISRLEVKSRKAKQILGKDIGTYITIELPSLTDNFTEADERIKTIGGEIRRLLPVNGLILVAGLGNEEITPDSLEPKTGSRVLSTRHITGELARATGLDKLRPVAVINTGVTGQTGIETGEYILSIVNRIRPNAVRSRLAQNRAPRLHRSDKRRGYFARSGSREPQNQNQSGDHRRASYRYRRADRSGRSNLCERRRRRRFVRNGGVQHSGKPSDDCDSARNRPAHRARVKTARLFAQRCDAERIRAEGFGFADVILFPILHNGAE